MKKLVLTFYLASMSLIASADVVTEPMSTGSSGLDFLLIGGIIAVAALLFVRYRRGRKQP